MSNRIEGHRVVCHECHNEWDRAHGGLRCPRCESEFVEILEPGSTAEYDDPPEEIPTPHDRSAIPRDHPLHAFNEHNPWQYTSHDDDDDDDDGGLTHIQFNNGLGRGSMTFSARSWTSGGPGRPGTNRNDSSVPPDILANFNEMFSSIVGGPRQQGPRIYGGTLQFGGGANRGMSFTRHDSFGGPLGFPSLFGPAFGAQRQPGQNRGDDFAMGPDPFALLSAIFNPAMARAGDGVYTQEAFDRIMSDLMAQNQQNGAPPAAEDVIKNLPRKKVDQKMLGSDGLAECSICMDNVEVGTEVATLPCSHWFHYECIESWLKEHDTCPHCRKPITPEGDRAQRPQSGRRRSSRRSSSIASPMPGHLPMAGIEETGRLPDSPTGLREARERYYGSRRDSDMDMERPREVRRTSTRSSSGRGENSGAGSNSGGMLSTIRSRLPF